MCFSAMASSGGNCVAYAREVTGVHLDGNAASWWPHAEGHYDRGHQPSVGAILVFKPYGGMHVGHVAVVSRVVGPHEILVDQANWVRGRVTKSMSVVDASPANDWTSVKVQYAGTHGRANPTYGFIYPRAFPASFSQTIVEAKHDDPETNAIVEKVPVTENVQKDRPEPVEAKQTDDPAKTTKPALSLAEKATAHHKDKHEQLEAKQAEPVKMTKPASRLAENVAAHRKDKHEQVEAKPVEPAKTANPVPSLAENATAPHKDKHEQLVAKRADPAKTAEPVPSLAENATAHHKDKHEQLEAKQADPATTTKLAPRLVENATAHQKGKHERIEAKKADPAKTTMPAPHPSKDMPAPHQEPAEAQLASVY
jgi:surface antigen